jgi:hypothetical protein
MVVRITDGAEGIFTAAVLPEPRPGSVAGAVLVETLSSVSASAESRAEGVNRRVALSVEHVRVLTANVVWPRKAVRHQRLGGGSESRA